MNNRNLVISPFAKLLGVSDWSIHIPEGQDPQIDRRVVPNLKAVG